MTVRLTNDFLLTKVLPPPLSLQFGRRFFICIEFSVDQYIGPKKGNVVDGKTATASARVMVARLHIGEKYTMTVAKVEF